MSDGGGAESAKSALRSRLLAARSGRPPPRRQRAADLLPDQVLALPEVQAAATVAAYSSLPSEPGTGRLLEALYARGVTVLLPVLQADRGLDWVVHEPGRGRLNRQGTSEPAAPMLGSQALTSASVVICPGVAGDRQGHRLGRGGGSYDRALASLDHSELRCLLLYDDEVLDAVPTTAHDQPVDVLVTPTRHLRVSSRRS